MAFRASSQIKVDGYSEAKRLAVHGKSFAQAHRDFLAAGNVSANLVIQILQEFKSMIERFTTISAIPGLGAYVQDQEADGAYNVGAEFTAMRNAAIAVRDRIIAEMPKATAPAGVVGRIAIYTLETDGGMTTAVFTSAQTANLRVDLETFIATIV
jgi:hypothetical protein